MPDLHTMQAARPQCHHLDRNGYWCSRPVRLRLRGNGGLYLYACPVHGFSIGRSKVGVKAEEVLV